MIGITESLSSYLSLANKVYLIILVIAEKGDWFDKDFIYIKEGK